MTHLGVAIDIGTTTLRLLLIRLSDGVIVGEAGAYNPQIARGADVISRIVAAERGLGGELAAAIRGAVASMVAEAAQAGQADAARIRGYSVAGNLAMIHLLLGADPSGIRRVPSAPAALAFPVARAAELGWPGGEGSLVFTAPAAGGWVGGDIVAGAVRAGFSRSGGTALYVDLGTNGEIVFGGADFALACACSAGPAFEGGGIRCGMRAERGAVDGAAIDAGTGALQLSAIGGGRRPRHMRLGADRSGGRVVPRRVDRPRRPADEPCARRAPRGRQVGPAIALSDRRKSRSVGTGFGRADSRQGGGLRRYPLAGRISRGRSARHRPGYRLRQLRPLPQPPGGAGNRAAAGHPAGPLRLRR